MTSTKNNHCLRIQIFLASHNIQQPSIPILRLKLASMLFSIALGLQWEHCTIIETNIRTARLLRTAVSNMAFQDGGLALKPSRTKLQCEQWQKVDLRLFGTDPQFKIKRQTSSCEMSLWWDSINTTHIHPLHFQFFHSTAIPDRWTQSHLHLQMEVGLGRHHPGDCEDWDACYAWFGNLFLERFAQGYGGIRYHWYNNQQSWIGSAIDDAVQRWCLIPFILWLTIDWLIFFFGRTNTWATTLLPH